MDPMSWLSQITVMSIFRILGAILVLLIGRWLAAKSRTLLRRALLKTELTGSLVTLFLSITYYTVIVLTVMLSLAVLGVPTASILTVLAVVVIVLGIALQESLGNFAATVIFLLYKPFAVGDLVEGANTFGTVQEIQLFNTVIRTFDYKTVTVPNSQLMGNNIINYSHLGILRADSDVSISYSDDLLKAKKILEDMLAADERVLADPPATVIVKELADSGIILSARPFVKVDDYWDMKFGMNEKIKLRFDEEDVTIPFPQRDVHLYQKGDGSEQ